MYLRVRVRANISICTYTMCVHACARVCVFVWFVMMVA